MDREEIQNKLNELLNETAQIHGTSERAKKNLEIIWSLQDRWECEKEYEDFEEYKAIVYNMFLSAGFLKTKLYKNFTIKTNYRSTEIEIKIYKSGKVKFTF